MNSKKIETNSIIHLRRELELCPRVITNIPDNDRTPSWDGDIFLYNTDKLEKKDMHGVIRVQVKGKKVSKKTLKTEEISYPVEVADLVNFRSAGGTIFFVVYIADDNHYKIYYNSLLPIDLEEYLSKVEVNQKSKNIKLIKFPARKKEVIFYILFNFIKDSRKQQSTAKTGYINDSRIAQYDKLTLSITSSRQDMFEDMFRFPRYIYGRKKDIDVEIPLSKVYIKSFGVNNIKTQVKVGNNVFCEKIFLEESYDKTIIRIGAGFTITINKTEKKVTLNYVQKGYLEDRMVKLVIECELS